jgi:hypothetical protein
MLAALVIALQSCTPVFAQSEASKGAADPVKTTERKKSAKQKKETEKELKPAKDEDKISDSETDKAVFEKKENEPGTWEEVKEKADDMGRTLGAARTRRQDSTWTFTGNYSLFEMWTLTKYGLTVGYNKDESTTYEFEYMRGSLGFGYFGIDLGEISEQRFGLNWRTYGKRNSFSFVTGLYYNMLDMHLGSDALATVAGTQRAKVDLLEIETVGLHWGIGNRWQTKGGFVWGADWIAINLPLWIVKQEHPFIDATTSAQYRDDAKDALRFFRRIPEIAALKIQLGFSF